MLQSSGSEVAQDVQELCVHRLGNLTLSAYNSKLSTGSFRSKQTKRTAGQLAGAVLSIGYRNGLSINNLEFSFNGEYFSLASIGIWNRETIEARTNAMINQIVKLYELPSDLV
jgi:hypothetical protein